MDDLQCWKCGAALGEPLLPLPRTEACPQCGTDLHVCRMCTLYDTSVAKSCREPIAEEVRDKERASFCDYLELRPSAHAPPDRGAADAGRDALSALFGLDAEPSPGDPAAAAKRKLEDLFGESEDR